jgi:hypothetical protein
MRRRGKILRRAVYGEKQAIADIMPHVSAPALVTANEILIARLLFIIYTVYTTASPGIALD